MEGEICSVIPASSKARKFSCVWTTPSTRSLSVFKKNPFTTALLLWLLAIFLVSVLDFSDMDEIKFEIPHLDKIAHFTLYLVAAGLAVLAARERGYHRIPFRKVFAVLATALIGYGIILEVVQMTFTSVRSLEFLDILANAAGTLVGLVLLFLIISAKSSLKWEY